MQTEIILRSLALRSSILEEDEYCISAVPSNLYGLTEEELFLEMLDQLESDHSKGYSGYFCFKAGNDDSKAAVQRVITAYLWRKRRSFWMNL